MHFFFVCKHDVPVGMLATDSGHQTSTLPSHFTSQEVTNMDILVQKSTFQVSDCSGREHQKEETWVHYLIECVVGKGEFPFETIMTNIGPP